MAQIPIVAEHAKHAKLVLNVESVDITTEQFFRLCRDNPDFRLELTAQKGIVIMAPTGYKTGIRNAKIVRQLVDWAERDGTGVTAGTDAGSTLPNGAIRGPDASWMSREKWDALTPEQQERFVPTCPDFVLELRSPGDLLSELKTKLTEYMENGAQLGLLIDPFDRKVYVYRPDAAPECIEEPASVRCDPPLHGFNLNLTEIWA